MTAEKFKDTMTASEWEKVFAMSQDRNLYSNLISSLFPTIHGELFYLLTAAVEFMPTPKEASAHFLSDIGQYNAAKIRCVL